jgi:hypothetical protein
VSILKPLDVIWYPDETIRPPGPKMGVCIEPKLGLFFRINTDPKWQTPVRLIKQPYHPFLNHDSYLECGDPLELDDYVVDECLRRRGVIGAIHPSLVPDIYAAVQATKTISAADKESIRVALGIPSPSGPQGQSSK